MKRFLSYIFATLLLTGPAFAVPPADTVTPCGSDPSYEIHHWTNLNGSPRYNIYQLDAQGQITGGWLWSGTTPPPPAVWSKYCPDPLPTPTSGMTWTFQAKNPVFGTVQLGCSANGQDCDPYQGDTLCTASLPVLCFNDVNLPRPPQLSVSQSTEWSGGIVATTPPAAGNSFATRADVNAYCAQVLGDPSWRVAEFHDGWGWNFHAYGGVGDETARMWTDINDQQNGNCWAN